MLWPTVQALLFYVPHIEYSNNAKIGVKPLPRQRMPNRVQPPATIAIPIGPRLLTEISRDTATRKLAARTASLRN
jgi:hypothetical protein